MLGKEADNETSPPGLNNITSCMRTGLEVSFLLWYDFLPLCYHARQLDCEMVLIHDDSIWKLHFDIRHLTKLIPGRVYQDICKRMIWNLRN